MAPEVAKLVAAALALPEEQRAEVIDALVSSLDGGDDLDDDDRERLHEALRRSDEQFRAGQGIPAEQILARLRDRSR
jgi:hypothetical protein